MISRQRQEQLRNPHKHRARQLLHSAIESGRVIRPGECRSCGAHCKPDAHHEDYEKPYDVLWLCKKCHSAHHKAPEVSCAVCGKPVGKDGMKRRALCALHARRFRRYGDPTKTRPAPNPLCACGRPKKFKGLCYAHACQAYPGFQERHLRYVESWRQRNPDKQRDITRKARRRYREAHPEKEIENRLRHAEKARLRERARRERFAQATGQPLRPYKPRPRRDSATQSGP